jgi:hypothetical protein
MNRKVLAVLTGLVALSAPLACSSSKTNPASAHGGAEAGKPSAPVAVDAQLAEGQARVTLRFDAPASDVRVNVSGADGLEVKSAATPVEGGSFAEAGSTAFDVAFTPGPGRSHLVVAVTGTFRGAHQTKVASFSVGEPSAEQQQRTGNTLTNSEGQRIKVMPSPDAK